MTVKLIQIGLMPFLLFPVIYNLPVYRAIKNFVILKETLKAFDDFKNKQKSVCLLHIKVCIFRKCI